MSKKRVYKKKVPPPKPITKGGVNKLKVMQEKFNAKKAFAAGTTPARTTRSTAKKAAAADDPLWEDDVEEEEKEEEEYKQNEDKDKDKDEEIAEEQPNKKRKNEKPAETKNNKNRKKSTKKKRNASPAKPPRECWPERKVGVRPETLNQMMDITTRGKVKALKKPIEKLQVATMPHARSDKFAEQTNPTITGAVREQLM